MINAGKINSLNMHIKAQLCSTHSKLTYKSLFSIKKIRPTPFNEIMDPIAAKLAYDTLEKIY